MSAVAPTRTTLAYIEPAALERATFGIRLQPEGGSIVGRPTAPRFIGSMVG